MYLHKPQSLNLFNMLMAALFACQFGTAIVQMKMAIPRNGRLKFSPISIDDARNDDWPFNRQQTAIGIETLFMDFIFPDLSCIVVNLVSIIIVFIVIWQRKLNLARFKWTIVLVVTSALIIPFVWISAFFNGVENYERPVWKDGAAHGDEQQAQMDRYFWFLNKVKFVNSMFRLLSISLDLLAVVIVVVKVAEFRNPRLCGRDPFTIMRARRASATQAKEFAGQRESQTLRQSHRGCPMTELSKRMAYFPLIQSLISLPDILDFFIYQNGNNPGGGMYGCFAHWGKCKRLESLLVDHTFASLFGASGGLLFSVVWFAYQPGAFPHVKRRCRELWARVRQALAPAPRADEQAHEEPAIDEIPSSSPLPQRPSEDRAVSRLSDDELVRLLGVPGRNNRVRAGAGAGAGAGAEAEGDVSLGLELPSAESAGGVEMVDNPLAAIAADKGARGEP